MRARRVVISILIIVAATAPPVVALRRMTTAQEGLMASQRQLSETASMAREVIALRHQSERISWRQRPTEDALALVNTALDHAGLPRTRLTDLRNEADGPLSGSRASSTNYRQQSLAASFKGMTVADLGAFLAAWTSMQSVWTVTSITLTHGRESGNETNTYDCTITLSTIYVEAS